MNSLFLTLVWWLVAHSHRDTGYARLRSGNAITVFVPCGMALPFYAFKSGFERRTKCAATLVLDNAFVLLRRIRKGERPDVLDSRRT